MPIPLTYSGNDDNALETLVADAGLAFAASANTHQNIDALQALTGITLNFSGNDYNVLEALAAQYTPFTLKLDDAGAFFAVVMAGETAWKAVHPANAPDYLETTMELVNTSIEYFSMPSELAGCIAVTDEVIGFEVDIIEAPNPLTESFSGAFTLGANLTLLNLEGARIKSVSAVLLCNSGSNRLRVLTNSLDGGASFWEDIATFGPGTPTGRVGIYYNPTTGKIGTTYNGEDRGYVAALPAIMNAAHLVPGIYQKSVPTVMAGQPQRLRLHGAAAEMTQEYPAGAVDLYGAVI